MKTIWQRLEEENTDTDLEPSDEKLGCIYIHTNTITGKSYIGQTIQGISRRWTEHKRDAKANRYKDIYLHKAIRKYGTEDSTWVHETLINNIPQHELDDWEVILNIKDNTTKTDFAKQYGYADSYIQKQIKKRKNGKEITSGPFTGWLFFANIEEYTNFCKGEG